MMSKLTADDEQTLLESVKQAVHYVDEENMSPNDAIIKVARDMSLSPGFVRASVNAFNNGRQVSQWNANDSALDKLAEFQMADYDAVHREIWGKTEKEAHDTYTYLGDDVHSDYSKAPQWAKRDSLSKLATLDLGIEKKAEDEVPEHVRQHETTKQANSVWDAYARAKRSCEDARVKESAAKDVLTTRLALLTNYFKKFAYDRLPFDVVDKAAQSYYGGKGVALMDIMSDRFPKEKRAADTKRYWDKPLSKDAEPFTFIVNAIKAAADLSSASNALGMAKQAQEEAKGALLPFVPTPTQPKSEKDTTFSISLIDGGGGEKEASDEERVQVALNALQRTSIDTPSIELEHDAGNMPLEKLEELVQQWEGEMGEDGGEPYPRRAGAYGLDNDVPISHEEALSKYAKEKQAVGGLLTGAIIGGGAKPAMEALMGGSAEEDRVNKILGQLSSPEHDDELRKIQAQVMLTEMMSDPDNPISEYNPEAVLQAYNDITQLAPRLSEQPAAMQPLLAKRLAGDVEPFEIKEIGEIERGLQQTSSAPDIMKQSNDSILI
jgi:hypothetical protein